MSGQHKHGLLCLICLLQARWSCGRHLTSLDLYFFSNLLICTKFCALTSIGYLKEILNQVSMVNESCVFCNESSVLYAQNFWSWFWDRHYHFQYWKGKFDDNKMNVMSMSRYLIGNTKIWFQIYLSSKLILLHLKLKFMKEEYFSPRGKHISGNKLKFNTE